MFDAIPGPEQRNAARLSEAGAGLMTNGSEETASFVLSLLGDENARRRMSECAGALARPEAAAMIARLALDEPSSDREELSRRMTA
jgi:UDP-N-acetylglucosamine:LPS N-acetylglucosamine transferase